MLVPLNKYFLSPAYDSSYSVFLIFRYLKVSWERERENKENPIIKKVYVWNYEINNKVLNDLNNSLETKLLKLFWV